MFNICVQVMKILLVILFNKVKLLNNVILFHRLMLFLTCLNCCPLCTGLQWPGAIVNEESRSQTGQELPDFNQEPLSLRSQGHKQVRLSGSQSGAIKLSLRSQQLLKNYWVILGMSVCGICWEWRMQILNFIP